MLKIWLSSAAIIITCFVLLPYLTGILRGKIIPHVFSWVIWGITTLIVFFAQLKDGGGPGAWAIGFSALLTLLIALLSYLRRGDISITRADWLFFIAALLSLPLWYLTADPWLAVVVLTAVDLLGFGPTLRKVIKDPFSEPVSFFCLFIVRNLLVIGALANYSLTTVLFPASVALVCVILVVTILVRRRQLEKSPNSV